MSKSALIIGAGPAGLTAAYELVASGYGEIVIVEATDQLGGLSRTVNYKGNRIDIGGHRFFSKSEWVMRWWLDKLPLADAREVHSLRSEQGQSVLLSYQGQQRTIDANQLAKGCGDDVMLMRNRISRILFAGKFFDYPLKLSVSTAVKLGPIRVVLFGLSYLRARLFPRPETTLEDFFINRFGVRLFRQFFKDYTEKVWGRACNQISAEWGAQRVKSLSIGKAIVHSIRSAFFSKQQRQAEQTSLIEFFLYPKFGPGQMWDVVARRLKEQKVPIRMNCRVESMQIVQRRVAAVTINEAGSANPITFQPDVVISTMAIADLYRAMEGDVDPRAKEIALKLEYRDFITVGLLYRRHGDPVLDSLSRDAKLPDNWIYIQEPGVKVGRVQIFNNWSPYMVDNQSLVWVGLEFFCSEGDALWTMDDPALIALAKREMEQIHLGDEKDALDGVVIRMPKAYPGYYGAYEQFDVVRADVDAIENLFLIGRNGMHRYNNQDHSMLSARKAVEAIMAGSVDKSDIWAVNIDDDYHEENPRHENAQSAADFGRIDVVVSGVAQYRLFGRLDCSLARMARSGHPGGGDCLAGQR